MSKYDYILSRFLTWYFLISLKSTLTSQKFHIYLSMCAATPLAKTVGAATMASLKTSGHEGAATTASLQTQTPLLRPRLLQDSSPSSYRRQCHAAQGPSLCGASAAELGLGVAGQHKADVILCCATSFPPWGEHYCRTHPHHLAADSVMQQRDCPCVVQGLQSLDWGLPGNTKRM